MKNILLVLYITFSFLPVSAQTTEVNYDTCQQLSQLNGEWRSINGNDTIKVFLKYHVDSSHSFKSVLGRLYGWHEYKQGATVVESDYAFRFTSLPYDNDVSSVRYSIILNFASCLATSNTLTGIIRDYLQSNETHSVSITLNSSHTVMTWSQEHSEGYGFRTGATGMTLPKQFILLKQ